MTDRYCKNIFLYICIIFSSFLSAEWVEFYKKSSGSKAFKIFVDYDYKKTKFSYDPGKFSKTRSSSELNYSNLADFQLNINSLEKFLNDKKVDFSWKSEIVKEFKTILFLGEQHDKIRFFSLKDFLNPEKNRKINQNIESVSSLDLAYKSIEGISYTTSLNNQFSMRLVLDKKKNLIGFSLFNSDSLFNDLIVAQESHRLEFSYYKDKKKEFMIFLEGMNSEYKWFELFIPSMNEEQKLVLPFSYSIFDDVIIPHFKSNSLELQKVNHLKLSSENANHEEVIQVGNKNIFYKDIDDQELINIFSDIEMMKNYKTSSHNTYLFRRCNEQRLLFNHYTKNTSIDNAQIRNACLKMSAIFASLEMVDSTREVETKLCFSKNNLVYNFSNGFFGVPLEDVSLERFRSINQQCLKSELVARVENDIKDAFKSLRTKFSLKDNDTKVLYDTYSAELVQSCQGISKQECVEKVAQKIDLVLKKEQFKKWIYSINRLTREEKERIDDQYLGLVQVCEKEKEFNKCIQKGLKGLISPVIGKLSISLLFDLFPSEVVKINENEISEINDKFKSCIEKYVEESDSDEYVQNFENSVSICQVEVLSEKISTLASTTYENRYGEDSKLLKSEYLEKLNADSSRNVKKMIRNHLTPTSLKEAISDGFVYYASLFSYYYYTQLIEEYFPIGFDVPFSDINEEIRNQIQTKIVTLISGDEMMIKRSFLNFLINKVPSKDQNSYIVLSRDVAINLNVFITPYLTAGYLSKFILGEDALTEVGKIIDSESLRCFKDVDLRKDIFNGVSYCQKSHYSDLVQVEIQKRITYEVSTHFDLTSKVGIQIMNPLAYSKTCLDKINSLDSSVESFKKKARACVMFTFLDISLNLINAKINSLSPVLDSTLDIGAVPRFCYGKLFLDIAKENNIKNAIFSRDEVNRRSLFKAQNDIRNNLTFGASLLSLIDENYNNNYKYRMSDKENIVSIIDVIASSSVTTENWFLEKVTSCQKESENMLLDSFRSFVIKKIPNLSMDKSGFEVLSKLLDYELIELILKFIKINENKTMVDSNYSNIPTERVITPELGLTALQNFIGLMGSFIDKGFVFDKKAMITELVVFQSELKDFLKWYIKSIKSVTIKESQEFFKESKLADHIVLAVFSAKTKENFDRFTKKMKRDELNGFYKKADCYTPNCLSKDEKFEYNQILDKYSSLSDLIKEMTLSYDFRRIIRPQSKNGEDFLKLVKETHLLPTLLGLTVSSHANHRIDEKIANFILDDNTAGGFSERFVEAFAQHELNSLSHNKWGITKFLFYDDGDFDWTKIRSTKSGQAAIKYFGKNLLLPRIFNRTISSYSLKMRNQQFMKLLKKAQSEYDD